MKDLQLLFQASLNVVKRPAKFTYHPAGFDVVMRLPGAKMEEIVCSLPCDPAGRNSHLALVITAIPEMLDRLGDHCEWCADCDWQHDPDQTCRFGQLWEKLRGE